MLTSDLVEAIRAAILTSGSVILTGNRPATADIARRTVAGFMFESEQKAIEMMSVLHDTETL